MPGMEVSPARPKKSWSQLHLRDRAHHGIADVEEELPGLSERLGDDEDRAAVDCARAETTVLVSRRELQARL
jgi:hypothetical protein